MHIVLSRQSGAGMWHLRIRCRWKKHSGFVQPCIANLLIACVRCCYIMKTFHLPRVVNFRFLCILWLCSAYLTLYIVFLVTKCFGVAQIQNSVFVVMNSQTHITSNMIRCSEAWSTQCPVSLRYNWLGFIFLFSDLWCVIMWLMLHITK